MGTPTPNGSYTYDETDLLSPLSDALNLLGDTLQDSQESQDALIAALTLMLSGRVLPYRVAGGRTTMASAAWTAVNFPAGRFTVPPLVIGSPSAQGAYTFSKYAVTATGFTGAVVVTNTGSLIASAFDWFAIQMTSTAAAG